ncbi:MULTISPECIES: macro domain-containing protein [unclassified Coleofasciculus]|uniref:macro domain-containing protein n=1 Tax=unclassified Coleofasciculus TaxID=2692782 RepID=UPI0018820143|nr:MULTISPECIES: macro domain-containing protein [unclassified Coleofasciculus]MBE9127935.1 macro domain-containing protein [Coleofasciculus sp. LEGE 07081]MBE9150647.1 macro domain-containing protein [Coleofasciculus sp. LEGE 07092]
MKLILVDPKQALCKAWEEQFQNLPNVEIVQGYFERLPKFDCMVSAANSFGMMDGGVDLAIVNFFGQPIMKNVQTAILRNYLGEQPVGTSMIVKTGHPHHPFIAHTPTMRVPMPIAHTDHVYSAMWAMLLAVHHHNWTTNQKINIVACPGLGTTTGKMPYAEAAQQMAMAYKNFLHPPKQLDWDVITQRAKPLKSYQIAMEYWATQKNI